MSRPGLPSRVAVVADHGPWAGLGHLARCLAVRQGLARLGVAEAVFLTPLGGSPPPLPAPARWLAHPGGWAQALAEHFSPAATLLLLDSYAAAPEEYAQARRAGFLLTAFCDAPLERAPEADILVNPCWEPGRAATGDAALLAGLRHQALRAEVRSARPRRRARLAVRRLAVSFGGSDPDDVTAEAVAALGRMPGLPETLVILGPDYGGRAEPAAGAFPCMRVLRAPPDLPALFASCDLALAGAGQTACELARLGVPALLAPLAPEQRPLAAALADAGAALALPEGEALGPWLGRALPPLLARRELRQALGDAGRRAVDGRGAERIARAMLAAWRARR